MVEQRLARPKVARCAGILFGGAVAGWLSPVTRTRAAIIAGFNVAGSVAMLVVLPHPIWFALAARHRRIPGILFTPRP